MNFDISEYRQLFEDAGGVFKELYIGDSVNGYEVNESAQLSPEQAARVDKIADRQEKILKSIQELKFNETKFAPLQMAYPLRFESAIKQRERALAKLQALPRRT